MVAVRQTDAVDADLEEQRAAIAEIQRAHDLEAAAQLNEELRDLNEAFAWAESVIPKLEAERDERLGGAS